jgi:uncharacterized membrane protein YebE (DUF533 family)
MRGAAWQAEMRGARRACLRRQAERAFLDALTARLALPAELVAQLERQVQGAVAAEPRTA